MFPHVFTTIFLLPKKIIIWVSVLLFHPYFSGITRGPLCAGQHQLPPLVASKASWFLDPVLGHLWCWCHGRHHLSSYLGGTLFGGKGFTSTSCMNQVMNLWWRYVFLLKLQKGIGPNFYTRSLELDLIAWQCMGNVRPRLSPLQIGNV